MNTGCLRCGRLPGDSHTEICALQGEIERLRHDIKRHIAMASELATENERLRAELAKCKSLLRRVDGTTSIEWAGFKGIKEDIRAALATPSEDK